MPTNAFVRGCQYLGPVLFLMSSSMTMLLTSSLQGQEPVSPDVVAQIAESLPESAPARPAEPRLVLVYSRTLGFRHASIPTGAKALQMLGEKTRAFAAVHSEDPTMFEADKLAGFDAVIMLNTTGECLSDSRGDTDSESAKRRKENLRQFVASGKGLMGIHSATDTMYSSKEYGDLIGGWFTGHPWHTEVPLKVDAPNHPLTSMFDPAEGFVIKDEIYQFAQRGEGESFGGYQPYSRDKLRVLLSLNTKEFDVSAGKRTDDDYAISWIREYEDGRVFYTVLGHNDFIFWNPVILQHYLAGVQYVCGDLPADASPSQQ
jgi:type 1 glutamine amidotransferase